MKPEVNVQEGWPEGWLVAAGAGVFAAVVARVVGDLALTPTLTIALFVFLVFGVLLGMFWGSAPAGGHAHAAAHDHHGHGPAVTPVVVPEPVKDAPVVVAEPVAVMPPASLMAMPEPASAPEVVDVPQHAASQAVAVDPIQVAAAKPQGLAAPRGGGGVADNLQTIEGIGPALEKLCHELGIYHFDQIAAWGAAETAWMDSNLKGFKGRVTRDRWVRQASLIGEVGIDEFQRRAKTNDY